MSHGDQARRWRQTPIVRAAALPMGIVWARPTEENNEGRPHQGPPARGDAPGTEGIREELAEVTAVVLAVLSEVTAELAAVIAELATRVEALENATG